MARQPEAASGRCRCGRVQWQVSGVPLAVSYCHCSDCRRATGAPLTVFVGYRDEQLRIAGEPAMHSLRDDVQRLFCSHCGTPIGYRDGALPREFYFYLGVMDAPETFAPECHAFSAEALPGPRISDDLPRYPGVSRDRE